MSEKKFFYWLLFFANVIWAVECCAEAYLHGHQFYTTGNDIVSGLTTITGGVHLGLSAGNLVKFDSPGILNGNIASVHSGVGYPYTQSAGIFLVHDLVLGSTATFTTPTTLVGNGCSLLLTSSLRLTQEVEIHGDTTINGQGNVVHLDELGCFKLSMAYNGVDTLTTSTLRLKNMTLVVSNTQFVAQIYESEAGPSSRVDVGAVVEQNLEATVFIAGIGLLELDNVDIILRCDAAFYGYLGIKNTVRILGPGYQFKFTPVRPCPGVQSGGSLYVGKNVTFFYRGLGRTLFDCQSPYTSICFDNCEVLVEGGKAGDPFYQKFDGWRLTLGRVIFDNKVTINNFTEEASFAYNTDQARSFELGNDGIFGEVDVVVNPGAQIQVDGYFCHNPLTAFLDILPEA